MKAVRCGARKYEHTCITSAECEWDKTTNTCKKRIQGAPHAAPQLVQQVPQVVQQVPQVVQQAPQGVPAKKPSTKATKTGTKANTKANNHGSTKTETKANKPGKKPHTVQETQLEIFMDTIEKINKQPHTKPTPNYVGDTVKQAATVHINAQDLDPLGIRINAIDFDADFKLIDKKHAITILSNPMCKASRIKPAWTNYYNQPADKSYANKLSEFGRVADKRLAVLHPVNEAEIELKPISLSVLNFLEFAYLPSYQRTQINTPQYKKILTECFMIRCYIDSNNNGFVAYDGCLDPTVPGQTVLGHKIHNYSAQNPNLLSYIARKKLKAFWLPDINNIQHTNYITDIPIRLAYVGIFGSIDVNVSMMLYMLEKESIPQIMSTRIVYLLEEFKRIQQLGPRMYDKELVVFHGTTHAIHRSNKFVTTSFFSTTTRYSIARMYAGDIGGVVYIMSIPPRFPWMNLNDTLSQILLPVGTSIVIDKTITVKTDRFIFCHVEERPIDFDMCISLFKNTCNRPIPVVIDHDKTEAEASTLSAHDVQGYPGIHIFKTHLPGSSSFYQVRINMVNHVIKDIAKAKVPVQVLKNDHQIFKRVLNEVLASRIYRVFGLRTFDLKILDTKTLGKVPAFQNASNFMISSVYEQVKTKLLSDEDNAKIAKGFIVDCIMGNWDAYNNENAGILNQEAIRTDVGGCLAFRGKGDCNIQYDLNIPPRDHITISAQPSFQKLQLSKTDIEESINYLRNLKDIEKNLTSVHDEFASFLECIVDNDSRIRYIRFVQKLCNVVMYRYKWYLGHHKDVIIDIFDAPSFHNNSIANNAGPIMQSPVAIVMTKTNFQDTITSLLKCKKR